MLDKIYYISILVFVVYVAYITIKYGVLKSISHSIYRHNKPFLFFAFMTGIGLPLVIQGVYLQSYAMNMSGILLILCGASPYFHSKTPSGEDNRFESNLHSIGAEGGMICMFLHLWVYNGEWWWFLLMAIPTVIAALRKFKNHTYWLEVIGMLLIALGLIF